MAHDEPLEKRGGCGGRDGQRWRTRYTDETLSVTVVLVSQKDISFDGNSQQSTSIFDIIFTGSYNSIQSKEQESK